MRDILFKAKRIDNGEWVEGLLWKKKYGSNKIFISCFPDKDDNEEVFVVEPDTICQYTGLTDKNGRKIWENDIFKHYNKVSLDEFESYAVRVVTWDKSLCRFVNHDSNENYTMNDWCVYEVIGNAFDNPELLEKAR